MNAQAKRPRFKRPTVVGSTSSGVRLWTHDGEFPVNIVVKRSAIDDCFHLTGEATNEFRWEIVAGNLDAISQIAAERHETRMWELVPGPSEDYRLIELGYEQGGRFETARKALRSGTISRRYPPISFER